MPIQISHSAVTTYTTCGLKYKYHYIDRIRPKNTTGALLFGSALDNALNDLIQSKNLEQSKKAFEKSFRWQKINNKNEYIPFSSLIVYSYKDYDQELLQEDDEVFFVKFLNKYGINRDKSLKEYMIEMLALKKEVGFHNMNDLEKRIYNLGNWLSLKKKALFMLRDYHKKILPKVKKVIEVQKYISLQNNDGDKITGYIDLIVEWNDGKTYILDNKTSSVKYEDDSAMKSQQLLLYKYIIHDEYKIDGVGFIVMNKALNKNRHKVCTTCQYDGSGTRYATCNNIINDKRCGSKWMETIFPETKIDIILNEVTEEAQNLVLQTFDEANNGIKNGIFNPNLESCIGVYGRCSFYAKCWYGNDDDLIQLAPSKK